jgi:agmatine deiminase
MSQLSSKPKATADSRVGNIFPAEWLPHEATWLSWPRNADTWPRNLREAQSEFIQLVKAIASDEPVRVMAGHGSDFDAASQSLRGIRDVEIVPIQTNDAWARDYAPTFVVNRTDGKLTALNWHYNAWGGKYPPYEDDQQVARKIAEYLNCKLVTIDLCLEGGALEIDATGLLLCTKSCAFDPHRNPNLSPGEIEQRIIAPLHAKSAIWLTGDAIVGDDTDGHIDQLARFTPNGSILYAWSERLNDSQQVGLARNLEDLRNGLAEMGRNDSLVPLPLPSPVRLFDAQLPASYCNFYITNGSVIVPAYGDSNDDQARGIIAEHFPGRHTILLPSVNLSVGLGSFHCLTQQQPKT